MKNVVAQVPLQYGSKTANLGNNKPSHNEEGTVVPKRM